jgi:hypothetical protein
VPLFAAACRSLLLFSSTSLNAALIFARPPLQLKLERFGWKAAAFFRATAFGIITFTRLNAVLLFAV